jgi:hypothetical protein
MTDSDRQSAATEQEFRTPSEEALADEPQLADIAGSLMEASHLGDDDEKKGWLAQKAREDLANYLRAFDSSEDERPMWSISRDDVDDYVGCELVDIAFGALGTSAVLVFERDDGSLHGLKLQPREDIKVCDVEVSD